MLRPLPAFPSICIERLAAEHVLETTAWDVSRLTTQLCERTVELTVADLRRIADATEVLVAISDDGAYAHIVGMVCLVWMPLPQGLRLLVESFVVDVDHRGTGIASTLMDAVARRAEAEGVSHISLTCNPKREAAQAFYRTAGFTAAATAVLRKPVQGR
ncbi:GNAT family N-acetyltransferase [Brevundimonas sp. BR2-1]|uniref:GNAT family N-acetyltransferase n=1 Tax=Brevundimonas sp. BR2-1 TaxID=3031123 RepID=UPI0030A5C353